VLINTVLLKARWLSPFERKHSKALPFVLPNGSTTLLPAMRKLLPESFRYSEGPGWQALDMPCTADVSLVVLLPAEETTRAKVEQGLDRTALEKVHAGTWEKVVVQLPLFGTQTELSLKPMWEEMGASRVFAEGLTRVAAKPYRLRDVRHCCMVEVNESGVVAAAATAAEPFGPGPAVRTPKRFIADRPFVWWIRHHATGAILFMGRFVGG
jgi:serpin B